MIKFKDIVKIIKLYKGVKTDEDMAILLQMKKKNISRSEEASCRERVSLHV
jgi:hypothetical protein